MTKPKNLILLLLLFIVVGIAAVSTNVIINGTSQLASNPDDFNVYFSNVKVNGVQDLSLVQSETSLVFNGEFSAVGDKKEITYDVTNASKNYDADIDITCTPSTTYLTITNSFDTASNLSATSTRTGVLSITLSKSYTGADLIEDISCTITASAVERTSQGTSNVATPVSPFYIGREISIGEEKFNIISQTDDTITMLAQYAIGEELKQSPSPLMNPLSEEEIRISNGNEIDIQEYESYTKNLLNSYINLLQTDLGESALTGNLLTLNDLGNLGCTIPDDNKWGTGGWTCKNSPYKSWLIKAHQEQNFFLTRTTLSDNTELVWILKENGDISDYHWSGTDGSLRPTITIPKYTLEYIDSLKKYYIGEEIEIDYEKFYVIADLGHKVKVLPQYNIDTYFFVQTEEQYGVTFADREGWECDPPPKEIDIQTHVGGAQFAVNGYSSKMKEKFKDSTLKVELITLKELKELGCTIQDDYTQSNSETCANSANSNWLINGQSWWTHSATPDSSSDVWFVDGDGTLNTSYYYSGHGIRPTITISKEALEQ